MLLIEDSLESSLGRLRAEGLGVELPCGFGEYAVFVDLLRRAGGLDWLCQRVLARRGGAFELVDLVLFLSAYFSASERGESIGAFARSSAEFGHELAAIGDRARWPTQSSVSRCLTAVDEECGAAVAQQLLDITSACVVDSTLCKACTDLDGRGEPWRVLHWDTTVKPLRQRALPEDEQLPEPVRHGLRLGQPGYAGRKRGEVMCTRSIVSDATSGAWLHVDLSKGSGSVTAQMARAVEASVRFVTQQSDESSRSVVVCDGVAGGIPQSEALVRGGMHVVTRLAEYHLLKGRDAHRLLTDSKWLPVVDSLSGPRREAIELGVRLVAGEPLRIVASRFAHHGRPRGAGETMGSWHYELFLTSLPAERWAANDIVTLYYGRTAIENRFSAENREFDLTRVFSFSPHGQLLASSVAMALWNLRIAFGLHSLPPDSAPVRRSAERPSAQRPACSEETTDVPPDLEASYDDGCLTESSLGEHLQRYCEQHTGWHADGERLFCPASHEMTRTSRTVETRTVVRFRSPAACPRCPHVGLCLSKAPAAHFRKEVTVNGESRPARRSAQGFCHYKIHTAQPALPPKVPSPPSLNSAMLRRHAAQRLNACLVIVVASVIRADGAEDPPPIDPFVLTPAQRQRRRLTIPQRVDVNARPAQSPAEISLRGPTDTMTTIERMFRSIRSG